MFFIAQEKKLCLGKGERWRVAHAATAAAARARGNEINTAKRDKIDFASVDLLYSESLTKSYQKLHVCINGGGGVSRVGAEAK